MLQIARSLLCIVFFCLSSTLLSFYTKPINPGLESHLLALRDPLTEKEAFREHMRKVGEYLAFSLAETLPTRPQSVKTLLDVEATQNVFADKIVLVTILRAGLPLFEGMYRVFPEAEGGFLVYQRDHVTLQPRFHASLLPRLEGKIVILGDPMIATGGSILAALELISAKKPKAIFIVGAIAAEAGLERIHEKYPNVSLFVGAVDPILNSKAYIVPGLGDAGDRSFGMKEEG